MDDRDFLSAYMYKAGQDINGLISRYASSDSIVFINENDKQIICRNDISSPSEFIELIWTSSYFIDKDGNKQMLYFNHKLLSLSAYNMDPITNRVNGLMYLNGFHITGAMKMMDSLANSGLVSTKDLMDKSYDCTHLDDKGE